MLNDKECLAKLSKYPVLITVKHRGGKGSCLLVEQPNLKTAGFEYDQNHANKSILLKVCMDKDFHKKLVSNFVLMGGLIFCSLHAIKVCFWRD